MSVATEFAPVVFIPESARSRPSPQRLASVSALPRPDSVGPALRLTRRGVLVLSAAVVVLALLLIGAAWLSAPDSATGGARPAVPDSVTVQPGDSLWSIASRVYPQRDPRAEVAALQRVNGLGSAAIVPGQVLRTH